MVVIMRFDSATRCGSSFTSSFTSAISAASTAMSLPIPPIVIPTSAFFSAGASFTPSPIMHTGAPALWYSPICVSLSCGRQFACSSLICRLSEIARAAFSWSPVNSTGLTPSSESRSIISALSALSVSASAIKPTKAPSVATYTTVQPREMYSSAASGMPNATPCSLSSSGFPARIAMPSTTALTPRPGIIVKSVTSAVAPPFFLQPPAIALPSGCSDICSADAVSRYSSSSLTPSCMLCAATTSGVPCVNVPVL